MQNWFINLPISAYAEEIASAINNHGSAIAEFGTGIGKTIYLPYYLLNTVEGIDRVYVTQPRVTQAETNAAAAILGSGASKLIGHITGRGTSKNVNAKILYMTEGIIMSKSQKGDMSKVLVVMDEAHELNIETIINLAKLRKLGCKILVASATANGQMFSNYLGGAPRIIGTMTSHHVIGSPIFGDVLTSYDEKATIKEYLTEGYSFITICPGKGEIEDMERVVNTWAVSNNTKVTVYKMHGELTNTERSAYLKHKAEVGLAVILATNIGRTGLTYPAWVKGIIDLGEVKYMLKVKGIKDLTTFRVSKAEVVQAAGRIGRIELEEGSLPYKYTLIGNYEGRDEYPKSATEIVDEREFVVNTLSNGVSNEELITPFDSIKYNKVLNELKVNGVVDENNNFTEKGKKIAPLLTELEFNQAIALHYAMQLGTAKEYIKILAIESCTKFGTVIDSKKNPDGVAMFYSQHISMSYANLVLFNDILQKKNDRARATEIRLDLKKSNDAYWKLKLDFNALRAELSAINKRKENDLKITNFSAVQEALDGYRKLSANLRRFNYKGDTQEISETSIAAVMIATYGVQTLRASRDRKVSPSRNGEYYNFYTGPIKSIGAATFIDNLTYCDQKAVELAFSIEPSVFKVYHSTIVDGKKVITYKSGDATVEVEEAMSIEEIHTTAINSISNTFFIEASKEVRDLNDKLHAIGQPVIVTAISTVPTHNTVEEQIQLIKSEYITMINSIIEDNKHWNDLFPAELEGYEVIYEEGQVILLITEASLNVPRRLDTIDLVYQLDYRVYTYAELEELIKAQEKKDQNLAAEQIELKNVLEYSYMIGTIRFSDYVDNYIKEFTSKYNTILNTTVYYYIIKDENGNYVRKQTLDEEVRIEAANVFIQAIENYYHESEFELSTEQLKEFAYSIEEGIVELDLVQQEMFPKYEECLENITRTYSSMYYHNKAIKLYHKLNIVQQTEESDLAAMLRNAMLK